MSDLMLEIMIWVIFIAVFVFGILLAFLFLIVNHYIMTDETKKELKKYKICYIVKGIKIFDERECYVEAKNKKQAIKEFYRYYFCISDVKEVE